MEIWPIAWVSTCFVDSIFCYNNSNINHVFPDEEKLFNGEEPDVLWEEFAPVATDLLERLQSCMSVENSPCLSSDDEGDIMNREQVDSWGKQYKQWLQQ